MKGFPCAKCGSKNTEFISQRQGLAKVLDVLSSLKPTPMHRGGQKIQRCRVCGHEQYIAIL